MRRQRLAKHEKYRLAQQITRPSEIAVYNFKRGPGDSAGPSSSKRGHWTDAFS